MAERRPARSLTDENGNAAVAWDQDSGDWGVEKVVAYLDYNTDSTYDTGELLSNASVIQWIYLDNTGAPGDLVSPVSDLQKVIAYADARSTDWNGDVLYVWLNPAGNVAGSLRSLHVCHRHAVVTFSTNLHTWISGEGLLRQRLRAAPTPTRLPTGSWSTWTTLVRKVKLTH